MANLNYKTRGNSTPQGKPRVYFCCHDADFEKYFEEISDEILSLQNCAIWYKKSDTKIDEEMLLDLKQMQLFVMPVTTKLLCSENDAINVEFRFAIENHIPVLPLMQESGLEDIFNNKCGDLQFLDKNANDATAISYEEKIKKYLESVLIGDELAEKIRAAFDAYVFLSYRKKDRKYAQELMRLIHKNDFCRDIAIWYDEFLTPGENFNDSIKAALQKSDLFVLAVTPNLVNEINYIMTTEYPMARDAGKPILPAEMVATDRNALAEKYAEIPVCADAHNETELSGALLDSIKKMAIKENDSSPEHNFFIGLAYLGGVDVEVDHERALSLITSATEAGLPEAMEKLVAMYNSGDGVELDYRTAIEWQEKLVEVCVNEYNEDKNERNARSLHSKLWTLGNYCYDVRDLERAKEAYTKMLELCSTCELLSRRDLSISYNKLGGIAQSQGNLEKAKEYYEECLKIREELAKETKTVESRRDLSISYNNLGGIAQSQGNLEKAKEYYEKALKIAEELAKETKTVESRRDLSISYEKLGGIAQSQGNLEKAKEYYEKDLTIAEELAKETKIVESRRDLSISYNKLGGIAQSQGNLEKAKEYYEECLKIREELAKETKTVQAYDELASSYYVLSTVSRNDVGLLEMALKIWQMLADNCPQNPKYAHNANCIRRMLNRN